MKMIRSGKQHELYTDTSFHSPDYQQYIYI